MDIAVLQRMLERERTARREAERLLEDKSEALYDANLRMLKQNASLEFDIYERTSEMQKAIHEANLAKEAEKDFLSKISHEIRTPMNAIIGMIHLMFDTALDEEQLDYIDSIHYSANLLKGLISDVLDISKIESGTLDYNPRNIHIREILKAIQQTFIFNLKGKPVEVLLVIDERIPQTLKGDDVILNQILMNLVGNAAKFTAQGFIEITATSIGKSAKEIVVEIRIRDSGIGISSEKLGSIFDKFSQAAENVNFQYAGTGLGLTITKQLVELYKGKIEVSSTLNEGTCFCVHLPFETTTEKIEAVNEKNIVTDTRFASGKILVAEDNPLNQKYLGKLLKKWNMDFDLAENGAQAVEMARVQQYHLILMDIQMPEMDGFKATIQIRNIASYQNTPIIGLSAFAFEYDVNESLASGMNDHLSKPFSPAQLRDKLALYMSSGSISSKIEKREFVFDSILCNQILDDFYEGDIEYARDMFSIFLKNISDYMHQLATLTAGKDCETLASILHKIKPTFPMVGLSNHYKEVSLLEESTKKGDINGDEFRRQMTNFIDSVNEIVPIIESELKRMNEYIAN
ncbi:MAG: signal transduction histidine kinase/CheY-like chemotaxis protein [Flavobacteriales bacterium]|jgi:signal transduction histidine kinase/CheY-like chemotaxis protein